MVSLEQPEVNTFYVICSWSSQPKGSGAGDFVDKTFFWLSSSVIVL